MSDPNNYRGIALIEVMSKIYISILTKRVTFLQKHSTNWLNLKQDLDQAIVL